MTLHEKLEQEIYDNGATLDYADMPGDIDGLIIANHIIVDSESGTYKQNVAMRHELEHFYTNPYNLMTAPQMLQRKMEAIADRRTAFALIPLDSLVSCWDAGVRDADELSEALEIDIPYIENALTRYLSIYGYDYHYRDRIINFMPLVISKEEEK